MDLQVFCIQRILHEVNTDVMRIDEMIIFIGNNVQEKRRLHTLNTKQTCA